MTRDSIAYGAVVDRHVDAFEPFADAEFDEVYISQAGGREPAPKRARPRLLPHRRAAPVARALTGLTSRSHPGLSRT
jgi:hypothetical protein